MGTKLEQCDIYHLRRRVFGGMMQQGLDDERLMMNARRVVALAGVMVV
jgi:hypothetical protein